MDEYLLKIAVENGVNRAIAKNFETIEMDGKTYRCIRRPNNENDYGRWEFLYKGEWHEVVSYGVRKELNKLL